ncbi:MAG TPA: phosphoglycerate dehydrogenase [Acidimicrobiales bacterium]|jgi:D-3-phosphoglycerate dehydrogenase|nr:phosphoglycerate dehydrogenase [Acidimicrobiales bacterium]
MARVLVTEEIAEGGLDRLRGAGHDVDVQLGLSPEALLDAVHGANALIIRSATKVTAEVLDAAESMVVVGRAGIGLDNVDVEHATERGVMVVNAPQSNVLSAAEQTIALLLAQARNIPQAHAALKDGRWERSRWEGVELADKVLGIIGLGRIGKLVAQRASAFGMRLLAYDPFVSAERARQMNVELVDLDDLVQQSDFVTIHVAKTKETMGLVSKELLAKAKPGVRIINVARGGIVDESALADAIRSGHVAGAALDVFAVEPITESPLFDLDAVVVTPHLGASTREAQDKAGDTIAEQVGLALAGDFVPYAVNVSAAEASETVRPFLPLAERLGRIYVALNEGAPTRLETEYEGQLADYDTRILTLSVLKGVFGGVVEEPVSYVNAPRIAAERGVEVRESSSSTAQDYVNLVTVRGGSHAVAGTLVGLRGDPRIVMIDDLSVDLPPAKNMLIVRNDDVPGMIAAVTGALAEAGINVGDMHLGHSIDGAAAMQVLATNVPVGADVAAALRAVPGIVSVHSLATD